MESKIKVKNGNNNYGSSGTCPRKILLNRFG